MLKASLDVLGLLLQRPRPGLGPGPGLALAVALALAVDLVLALALALALPVALALALALALSLALVLSPNAQNSLNISCTTYTLLDLNQKNQAEIRRENQHVIEDLTLPMKSLSLLHI